MVELFDDFLKYLADHSTYTSQMIEQASKALSDEFSLVACIRCAICKADFLLAMLCGASMMFSSTHSRRMD
jgi:hypothetical protein